MKVLAITCIRSEYDLLSPLLFKLQHDNSIELKLLVGGAHKANSFGNTVNEIIADGFDILIDMETLLDSDSNAARLKSASILLMSSIDIVRSYNPDLIIYAGDREDVMVGALLGGYLSIPTVHFYGGDHACDGYVDNPLRHAVSKLSTCHFVSTNEHKDRLLKIGEPLHRIFKIGSVSLDKFKNSIVIENVPSIISRKEIADKVALVIYHPMENEIELTESILQCAISYLVQNGFHCFIGGPNSDPGNFLVRQVIAKFGEDSENVTLYTNLSRDLFINLFKQSNIIIGNSSAGLLEASSIPIPSVNIGNRQRGRYSADNVIFVDAEKQAIIKGIDEALSHDFNVKIRSLENPFGDGNSSNRALKLIKSIDFLSLLKKTEDPLDYEK